MQSKEAAIAKQLSRPPSLHAGGQVWLPVAIANRFRWDWGDVGGKAYLHNGTDRALNLSREQRKAIEQAMNAFLEAVRAIERQHLEVIENTGTSALLHVPAGLNIQNELEVFQRDLKGLVSDDGYRLLFPRMMQDFESVSAAVGGKDLYLDVRLKGESGVEVTHSETKGGIGGSSNSLPSQYKHLVQIDEGEIRKK